ncbi:leucine-rich repeat protein [Pontimicrobium aquaticum]|uniref:Leucine rich repeat-containing protein n=1 Tax=Pontimicrobium aquaticum TaxID=2565367 RepID=A0A4U0EPA5_9FLAO|nr:leucine-rich repeat protein [Pontimicrobium aquaticum]TJY33380.1 hypothetical protein E5167_12835 [Pontimicrobium aquaticum]
MYLVYLDENFEMHKVDVSLSATTFTSDVINRQSILIGFYANGRKYNVKTFDEIEQMLCLDGFKGIAPLNSSYFNNEGRVVQFSLNDVVQVLPHTEPLDDARESLADFTAINGSHLVLKGVGGTITTKALLAAKFSFTEAQILDFVILNGNVYANIDNSDYETNSAAFSGDLDITSIIESNESLTEIKTSSGFQNATSLEEVNCKGLEVIGDSAFHGCTALKPSKINMPNVQTLGAFCFKLLANESSYNWVLPKVTSISSSFGECVFDISLPALTDLTGSASAFFKFNGVIDLPNVTSMGDPATNTGIFTSIIATSTLKLNSVLATNNGGGEDADVAYARGRGCTIIYY